MSSKKDCPNLMKSDTMFLGLVLTEYNFDTTISGSNPSYQLETHDQYGLGLMGGSHRN